MKTTIVTAGLLTLIACGATGPSSFTQYRDKCTGPCALPAQGCEGRDAGYCLDYCSARAEGLTATCAQCIAEHTGWETLGDGQNTTCSLFVGSATGSACASQCKAATAADPQVVRAQCELTCTVDLSAYACDSSTPSAESCISACVSATSGLGRLCAQCITEHTHWEVIGSGPGPDGGGGSWSCGYSVGRASGSDCAAFCTSDGGS
ncbi:MAG: hypothetical protein IPJ65_14810 [Archangiaceae bacterium]|nr:hypothetical protein [Archangiaceae bacterium]